MDADERSRVEWKVRCFHWRQIAEARARTIRVLRARAERAEAEANHFEQEYREVLKMCHRAGFSPYDYENAEGAPR